jgi:hypothetical protein
MHIGEITKAAAALPSAACRQQLQQLKTLTHTYTFVALEKSFTGGAALIYFS